MFSEEWKIKEGFGQEDECQIGPRKIATLKIKFLEAQWDSIQTVVERPKVSVVWSSEINSKYKTCHKCSLTL